MALRIEAEPSAEEWAQAAETRRREAPASEYDRARAPRFDLLHADLRIRDGDTELFPAGGAADRPGYSISLLDLVLGIDDALQDLDRRAVFSQADDALELTFERRGERVAIAANLDRSPTLEVPEDELLAEWRRFRDGFVRELRDRAPELLDWETLAPLREHAY